MVCIQDELSGSSAHFIIFNKIFTWCVVAILLGPFVGVNKAQDRSFYRETAAAFAHGKLDELNELLTGYEEADPDVVAVRARMLVRRGAYKDAEQLLRSVSSNLSNGAVKLELGVLLTYLGQDTEARNYLNTVLDDGLRAETPLDQYRGAISAGVLGNFRQANRLFRSAAMSAPDDPAIHTAWGELFLEKYNRADALQSFADALELDDEWVPAHIGMARVLVDENPPLARMSVDRALEIDPNRVEAHLFVAELELGDRNIDLARTSIEHALNVNPLSLEAKALVAAMAYLEDREDDFKTAVSSALDVNPLYGEIFRIAGLHVARAYRFDEAVALTRQAVNLQPGNSRAHAELGMHLLRTGDEPAARVALEESFREDPFDVITFNLLELMDTLDEFETFERGQLIVRLHPSEAPILKDYVLTLAQEALDRLSQRYNVEVEGPILIEVFPRHDDFAVRNLGLPGMIGALGACFGRVVTLDSPRARPPGDFNWRATLWHEIAHVITLQMSNQRVPRWLTEGISVYEEQREKAAWGRDQEISFAQALNRGEVLSLRDLNSGFSKPETISLSYFQASVLVEHIVGFYGEPVLHDLVRSYASGFETEEALISVGLDFDSLQVSFDKAINERFGVLRNALLPIEENIEEMSAGLDLGQRVEVLSTLAEKYPDRFEVQFAFGKALYGAGNHEAAISALEHASMLAPMATGIESPRGVIADIAQSQGNNERAMRELEALLEYDQTSLEAARQLGTLAEESGDQERLRLSFDRIIGIDPFDPLPHIGLGRIAMADGNSDKAILEFKVALAASPIDRVALYSDLARSYLMSGQFSEAKKAILGALELAPTYEPAQEILLRIIEEES
tara:strand:- start:13741 stop:16305 length:2565 start_codon:yes stop_codon:yes gene_type:complete